MNESKKNILLYLQKILISNNLMRYVENKFIGNKNFPSPPIFIIGLPRSGTTLLYQLLIDTYRFAYFNNLSNFFFTSPVLASYISLKLFGYYKPHEYNSKYGVAPGIASPSESGFIFRNWFNNEPYNKETIKQSLSSISSIYNAPFITKNLYNDFRIEILNDLFPKSVFIEVKRDTKFIGQSLLLARKKTCGNYRGWFGLKPLNYEDILSIDDPIKQVSQQILSIDKSIKESLTKVEEKRKISISYEELCENPDRTLKELIQFFNSNNIYPLKINSKQIPIKTSDSIKLNKSDWDAICKYL